ncbi:MAG: flagellin [Deltaproteobacteria bacterium]|jgi:flagellin|nr:flagellin [Deltaproteobacteria bacterium]MDG1861595.1 flagellin [SAR324 cluster bacterium]MBT4016089.1 flagellin [Deltaproteobacteria bacterium]MBT4629309.1 flagellin [Deltaproteobacteria bacterium]MBT5086201.1 flagellin [Deltaproteobacteria bacterium]
MSLRINNNIESMNAHRNLLKNDRALSKSLERLASGQKVNRAADDPAALVISEHMRAQVSGMEQAIRNNEVAISLVQTAEGSMNEISSILVSLRQRAISAANVGASDRDMIDANQAEIENALASIDRVVSTTQFGHYRLLDGTNAAETTTNEDGSISTKEGLRFHVGPNAEHMASTSIRDMSTSQLGRATVVEGELPNKSNFMSLADIDVRNEQGAQDALAIIDQALTEVATVRGELGAFQKHTLESNLTSMQVAVENMTAAESTIRDTDMAQELATFTRNQIMTQSATAQLAQANAMPQHVLRLLNG